MDEEQHLPAYNDPTDQIARQYAIRTAARTVGRLHSGVGRLALDTGLPVVANGASGTEGFWPLGATGPRIRPWGRYPLALRSEVLGVITAPTSREATETIRDALVRCTTQADSVTREMRRGR